MGTRNGEEVISDFLFVGPQDKAQPETQASAFGDVAFKAMLAQDTPGAVSLVKQPGSDGFLLSSAPLFQVCATPRDWVGLTYWEDARSAVSVLQVAGGREWFIHTIYMVRSRGNANRNIGKRSLEYLHHSISTVEDPGTSRQRLRRAAPAFPGPTLTQDIGVENDRGTNIQHISLDRTDRMVVSQRQPWSHNQNLVLERPQLEGSSGEQTETYTLPTLIGLAGLVLLACIVGTIVILLLRRKKREKKTQLPPYTTSSFSAYSQGPASMWSSSDSSEV